MDPEGTNAVHDYFGDSVIRFGLKEALSADPPLLTPYSYHPVIVELEEDEADEYLRLTRLLARYSRDPEAETLSPEALALLLKRSRLIGSARRKIPALVESIRPFRESRYNLVYCGDGRSDLEVFRGPSEAESEAPLLKQVDAVARILGRDLHMHVARYTSETAASDRTRILKEFEEGRMQALIAIRCLDEGVDVPGTRRAFILASSTNPRQFVQRRGRVLRVADGKDRAEIFDFLVAPPFEAFPENSPEFSVVRNLLRRELGRVVEFARLALNGPQAILRVEPLLVRYGLLDILAEERT
jgi:superfamily II DNA or RNA helicase